MCVGGVGVSVHQPSLLRLPPIEGKTLTVKTRSHQYVVKRAWELSSDQTRPSNFAVKSRDSYCDYLPLKL